MWHYKTARRGMALSAARLTAVRSVFAWWVQPCGHGFWQTWVWRTIATNYGRIIPTIYALAQIRLTRAECFELA